MGDNRTIEQFHFSSAKTAVLLQSPTARVHGRYRYTLVNLFSGRAMRRIFFAPLLCLLALFALPQMQAQAPHLLRAPSISDTQIAFRYADDIWLVSRDGGAAQRLTSTSNVTDGPASPRNLKQPITNVCFFATQPPAGHSLGNSIKGKIASPFRSMAG